MKVLLIFISIIIFFNSNLTFAKDTKLIMLEPFSSLCISEGATGFNWKNGDWHQVNFKNEKWVVKKISKEKEKCGHLDIVIFLFKSGDVSYSEQFCYSVKQFNSEYEFQTKCYEWYRDNGYGTVKIQRKNCTRENFYFKPNGRFQTAKVDSMLGDEPNDKWPDYADSLSLHHGYCSKL